MDVGTGREERNREVAETSREVRGREDQSREVTERSRESEIGRRQV